MCKNILAIELHPELNFHGSQNIINQIEDTERKHDAHGNWYIKHSGYKERCELKVRTDRGEERRENDEES